MDNMKDEISKMMHIELDSMREESFAAEAKWPDDVREIVEKCARDIVEIFTTDKGQTRPWNEKLVDARARLTVILSRLQGMPISEFIEIDYQAAVIADGLYSFAKMFPTDEDRN